MMKTYHLVRVYYAYTWVAHFAANLPAVTTQRINEDQRSLLSRTYSVYVYVHVHINRAIYVVSVSDA